jgi:hypothetical protein
MSYWQLQMRRSPERIRQALKMRDIMSDPFLFTKVFFDHRLWPKQVEILRSVIDNPLTAVKACHASGKTFTAAVAVLYYLVRYRQAVVITTAPTWTQVEKVMWGEIRSLVQRARYPFPKPLTTSLKLGPDRFGIGLSTNEGVRFQGFHNTNVLVVLDEAPGVLPSIYEAIEGIRAGGNVRVLAMGNPVISSGPFYDAFSIGRATWKTFTIAAFDTPNFAGVSASDLLVMSEQELDCNVRPYLVSRRWVKEKYLEWGLGHPLWEARVLGNFPAQSDDSLIPLTCLEMARLRQEGSGELCAGLDVAGPGEDETVLCVRRGPRIVQLNAWSHRDPRGVVVAALMPYKHELKYVNVDSIGIGFGMAQHLKDIDFPVREVNVGAVPMDKERFANLKAELYWGFRERALAGDLAGLTDEKTIAQLASIRYKHNSRGQVVIESKEEARKRGVKSPDRADAVILAFAGVLIEQAGLLDYYVNKNQQAAG